MELDANCNPVPIRIELYEVGTPNANPILVQSYIAQMNIDGSYTASLSNLAPGTYGVYLKADTYLQKFLGDMVIEGAASTINLTNLIPKDIAGSTFGDNKVDGLDLNVVIDVYNTQFDDPNYNARADIDCNLKINIRDISRLGKFYLQEGISRRIKNCKPLKFRNLEIVLNIQKLITTLVN